MRMIIASLVVSNRSKILKESKSQLDGTREIYGVVVSNTSKILNNQTNYHICNNHLIATHSMKKCGRLSVTYLPICNLFLTNRRDSVVWLRTDTVLFKFNASSINHITLMIRSYHSNDTIVSLM